MTSIPATAGAIDDDGVAGAPNIPLGALLLLLLAPNMEPPNELLLAPNGELPELLAPKSPLPELLELLAPNNPLPELLPLLAPKSEPPKLVPLLDPRGDMPAELALPAPKSELPEPALLLPNRPPLALPLIADPADAVSAFTSGSACTLYFLQTFKYIVCSCPTYLAINVSISPTLVGLLCW